MLSYYRFDCCFSKWVNFYYNKVIGCHKEIQNIFILLTFKCYCIHLDLNALPEEFRKTQHRC